MVMPVPKKILSLVDLRAGSQVQISVEKGRVVVEPKKKPRYTLAELLAQCRRSDLAPHPKDRAWLSGGPVGKEAL